MNIFTRCVATFWVALMPWAATAQGTAAHTHTGTPSAVACATNEEMPPAQLYGLWHLSLWPQEGGNEAAPASRGALLFERHPEHAGSVRGNLKRSTAGNDRQALVSGDVSNGDEFNLDESADGVSMDAVWEGNVTPGRCHQELRGIRRPVEGREAGEPVMNFVLKKASGWR